MPMDILLTLTQAKLREIIANRLRPTPSLAIRRLMLIGSLTLLISHEADKPLYRRLKDRLSEAYINLHSATLADEQAEILFARWLQQNSGEPKEAS